MNSTDRDTIKLILSVEQNKKKVKIICKNRNEGKTVAEAISNNASYLMASGYEDLNKGVSYKDFTYKFGSKDEAEYFKNKIIEVKNSSSSSSSSSSFSSSTSQDDVDVSGGNSNTTVIIIAAVMAVVVIGLFVWMRSK